VSFGKDWRTLCAAASEETDSEKLASLIGQILQAFDECDRDSMLSRLPFATPEG
jgi:hypothetical protein